MRRVEPHQLRASVRGHLRRPERRDVGRGARRLPGARAAEFDRRWTARAAAAPLRHFEPLLPEVALRGSGEQETRSCPSTGTRFAPPETWDQFGDQAKFFADAPNFYGTQYVGKDEAITGRFYELLVAEGGALFDEDWNPTFNSEAGVRAVRVVQGSLRCPRSVPAGVLNYLWDDTGLGFAFGHRRAESRLGRLGFVLQRLPSQFEGRRTTSGLSGRSDWFQRQAHAAGRAATRSRSRRPATTWTRPLPS